MRRLLAPLVLTVITLSAPSAHAASAHGCVTFASNGFYPSKIRVAGMGCLWAQAWIDQVTGRVVDQSPSAVQHRFRLRDGRLRLRCVGGLLQGTYDPYLHVSCRAGNQATAGQTLSFDVGS